MEIENNEMERLYAETFHQIEVGSIMTGRVLYVKDEGVIVDIGYKSEGFLPADEFSPEELAGLKKDSIVEVYVNNIRDSEGVVYLSKRKAMRMKALDMLQKSFETGSEIQGRITGRIKGGLSVDFSGVTAFLPNSQSDIRPTKDIDSLIGRSMNFRIIKLDNKHSNIIVSRRVILEEERKHLKAETLAKLKEGSVISGVVKNITDYGVFVDLGGLDGLLHISDISWGRITHPSEFFAVGDTVDVLVLKYDPESDKVTLGYKQKKPDPWLTVDERYPVGSRVRGKVTNVTDYGAFVEVEEGIEGLVHVSEIDWSSKPKHPSKYLSVGETIEAVVLKVDKNDRRISLSYKQSRPSPWELISQRYSIGQKVSGKVRSITDFGAFVGLPEGVDGLIHISDISWTRHIKHPSDVLKKGQKVDAIVLKLEPDKERIALGLKQLEPDPWTKDIPGKYNLGDEVKCRVLKSTDFGIFVEIESEVEGLIYSSETVKLEEPLKEGDEILARIIKIDVEERKIGLSMKHLKGVEG